MFEMRSRLPFLLALAGLLGVGTALEAGAADQPSRRDGIKILRVSTDANGREANGGSDVSDISRDGNLVAFTSMATNLVPNSRSKFSDVFVKNIATGAIVQVSRAPDGTEANGNSSGGTLAPDGKSVLFVSYASNLLTGKVDPVLASNKARRVFLRDLPTGKITLVSAEADGTPFASSRFGGDGPWSAYFSPDGKDAYFSASSLNLAPGRDRTDECIKTSDESYPDWCSDIFRKNLATGAITRLTVRPDGVPANGTSYIGRSPTESGLVFETQASNLDPRDTQYCIVSAIEGVAEYCNDSYFLDFKTGKFKWLSRGPKGKSFEGRSHSGFVTDDGAYAYFLQRGVPLFETNDFTLYRRSLKSGALSLVVSDTKGRPPRGEILDFDMTGDGGHLAFSTDARNIWPNPLPGKQRIFRVYYKDLKSGRLRLVTQPAFGDQMDGHSYSAKLSANGKRIVFTSDATNVIAGAKQKPIDRNGKDDVFVAILP